MNENIFSCNTPVITGLDSNNNPTSASIQHHANKAGDHKHLCVSNGLRPSEMCGRVGKSLVLSSIGSVLTYTVPAGYYFYVTDILMTITNDENGVIGKIIFRDGLNNTGNIIIPLLTPEPSSNTANLTTISTSLAEPLVFTTGVFTEQISGNLNLCGVMQGYLE